MEMELVTNNGEIPAGAGNVSGKITWHNMPSWQGAPWVSCQLDLQLQKADSTWTPPASIGSGIRTDTDGWWHYQTGCPQPPDGQQKCAGRVIGYVDYLDENGVMQHLNKTLTFTCVKFP